MTAKLAAKAKEKDEKPIVYPDGKSKERYMAETALDPATGATCTGMMFARGTMGKLEVTDLLEVLIGEVAKVRKGNMARPEAMLVAQAHTLDAIFTELARRSALNMGEYIEPTERYMRMALKAQAQCRATIETLAAMKNPPVVIAKQANISNGPQQVNNGGLPSRAEEKPDRPNELLEHRHEPRLDLGAPSTAGGGDPALVAVEAGHGA